MRTVPLLPPRPERGLAIGLAATLALLGRGCAGDDVGVAVVAAGAAGSAGFAASSGAAPVAGAAGIAALAGSGGASGGASGAAGVVSPLGGGNWPMAGSNGTGLPEGVPAGWVRYDDWSPKCPLWYPPTADLMPPPLEWQPCGPPVPKELPCRELKPTWSDKVWIDGGALIVDRTNGKRLLHIELTRGTNYPNKLIYLVGELDGPNLVALVMITPAIGEGCVMYTQPASDDLFAIGLRGNTTGKDLSDRFIGVLTGSYHNRLDWRLHKAKLDASDLVAIDWSASKSALIEQQYWHSAIDWQTGEKTKIYHASDPNGLVSNYVSLWGEQVFLDVGGLNMHGHYVWDKKGGTRPLLRWYDDFTRSAAHLGTDGTDMVWTYLERQKPTDETWVTSVMAAPYVLTQEELGQKARRLTAGVASRITPSPWQVGCGYAAMISGTTLLQIVRIADGASWVLSSEKWTKGGYFDRTTGVTCDEVFYRFSRVGAPSSLGRIRFNELGPPDPPK